MKKFYCLMPFRLKNRVHGFTLVESLMVVSVIGGLLAAIASVFMLTIRGYSWEYETESVESESQRAAVELDFFARRASSVTVESSGPLEGNRVVLTQPVSSSTLSSGVLTPVIFEFVPNVSRSTPTEQVGVLKVLFPSLNLEYVYSPVLGDATTSGGISRSDIRTPIVNGTPRPIFSISPEGGLIYRWEVAGVGGGVDVEGTIPLK